MIRKLLPILMLTFVNVIGFTLLIPVLPGVAELYIKDPNLRPVVYGSLISSYALFQFFAAPILGSLSDKYGRKPVLILSQLGTAVSWVIFGLAWFIDPNIMIGRIPLSLFVIGLSRVVDGITGGNISVAQAWISDATSVKNRAKAFGLNGAMFGIGFIFGPSIGGLSATTQFGYLGSAVAALLISIVTLAFIYFQLPESLPENMRYRQLKVKFWSEVNIFKQLAQFKHNSKLMNLFSVRMFFSLIFASYTTIIILLIENEFELNEAQLGLTVGIIGLYSIINQGFLVNQVAKRLGDLNTFFAGIISLILGLVMIPFLPLTIYGSKFLALLLYIANAYIINVGISIGQPIFKSLITKEAPENKQGKIVGIDESILSLGQAITPIIAGGLYAGFGARVFFLFAILLGIPSAVSWWNLKSE